MKDAEITLLVDSILSRIDHVHRWCVGHPEPLQPLPPLLPAWMGAPRAYVWEFDAHPTFWWSEELRPISASEQDRRIQDGMGILGEDDRHVLSERVCARRENILEARRLIELTSPPTGRVLCYELHVNMCCGTSEFVTDRLVDVHNVPPWDMWLVCLAEHGTLLCWVPESLVPLMTRAIDHNAEGCIGWIDEHRPADNLQQALFDFIRRA